MDDFGDYVEELEASPIPAVKLYVSSTLEEFGGLRRLLQGLPGSLDVPITVYNLDEQTHVADSDSLLGQSSDSRLSEVAESDLLLLLLDSRGGGAPVGGSRSHVEIEYDTALRHGCEVLAFERVPPSLDEVDRRLADFKEELRVTQTMGTLDQLSDALNFETIHDRLVKWLLESGRTHASGLVALGDQFVVSSDRSWRDNRVAHLDCWVMGVPHPRGEAGTATLMERANDEWNEACSAFTLRSSNVMRLHLTRAIELRPLDGHARYWLARLTMIRAADAGDWRDVLKHAEIATRVFEESGSETARAGLGHLLQAKAYRALGKIEGSTLAVRHALERLGWHSEPHLEACYLELEAGSESVAGEHLYDAFVRYPPSFAFAEHELTELGKGIETYHQVRRRLLEETRSQINGMHRFEIQVGRAILKADGRNESMKASLGLAEPSDQLGGVSNVVEQPAVKAVGNNDGLIRIADRSEDPVRLAGLGQSLSTLNHTRLVELERRLEHGYGLWVKATEAEAKLAEETTEARKTGLGVCAFILAVIGMTALTGQMPGVVAGSLAWVVLVVTAAGLLWWNRHELESAAAVVERATIQLKATATDFERLVGEYERDHTALRFYVPRTAEPHGEGKLWRLSSGSSVFTLVSNDAVAPHVREIVGGLPATPPSVARLYRATPQGGDDNRSAQADRWRAYACDLAVALDRR